MAFDDNTAVEVLAARRYLYKVFAGIFGGEPTAELPQLYDAALVGQSFAVLTDAAGVSGEGALALVRWLGDGAVDYAGLAGQYVQLFIGPGTPLANPWEAMHTSSSNRRLFSPIALEVRERYRAQGFLPEGYPNVSDDGLSLELNFLAALGDRSLVAFLEEGDWKAPLRASDDFLRNHLARWSGKFAWTVSQVAPDSFYAAAADALEDLIACDKAVLPQLL